MSLLKIDGVSKKYGRGTMANDGISLSVEAGDVFGLLGPNGAGKTTLVNQIIGLLAPTSGKIYLSGVDVVADPGFARQACSFQPQSQVPIEGVTARQAMNLIGRIRGGEKEAVRIRSQELLAALEIESWADKRGEALSGGVRRLVAFCMAAVVPGQLIILDEPTNDVDPLRRRLLWQEVRQLAGAGAAVLLVTHNVLEAERSVNRLAIIDHGRVVASGTAASLKEAEAGYLRLELILEPGAEQPLLPAFLTQSVTVGRRIIAKVETPAVKDAVDWASRLEANRLIEEYSIGPATLEDVYVRKIGRPDALEVPVEEVNHVVRAQLVS